MAYRLFSTSRQIIQQWCLKENQYFPGTISREKALSHWNRDGKIPLQRITELAKKSMGSWESEVQHSEAPIHSFTQRAVMYVESKQIQGNVVEVGAGHSTLAPLMLRLNRKVHLIDPCKGSLDLVIKNIQAQGLNEQNLTVTVGKVENYSFPEKNALIALQDVLPYCDPKEIFSIFQKMHSSLEKNALVTGNFFYHDPNRNDSDYIERELFCRFTLGATFMSDEVARAIFQEVGYGVMEYGTDGHRLYFTLKK